MSSGNNHDRGFPWNIRRMIIVSPYKQYIYTIFYGKSSQVLWADSWDKVLEMVKDRGRGTTAAVWIEGLLQMFDAPFKHEYVPKNINLKKINA